MHFTLIFLHQLLLNSLPELILLKQSHYRIIRGLLKLETKITFEGGVLTLLNLFAGLTIEVLDLNNFNSLNSLKGFTYYRGLYNSKGFTKNRVFS